MSDSISESSTSSNKWNPENDSYYSRANEVVAKAHAETEANRSPLDQEMNKFRDHIRDTATKLLHSTWAPPPGYEYQDHLWGDELRLYKVLPMGEDWRTCNAMGRLYSIYCKSAKRVARIHAFGCGNDTRRISLKGKYYEIMPYPDLRHGLEITSTRKVTDEQINEEIEEFILWADKHLEDLKYGWTPYKSMRVFDRTVKIAKKYKQRGYSTHNFVARRYAKRTLKYGGFLLLKRTRSCNDDACILAGAFGGLFHPFFHGFDLWFKKATRYVLICVKKQTIPLAQKFFRRSKISSTRLSETNIFT
jgi:hypothetical protein